MKTELNLYNVTKKYKSNFLYDELKRHKEKLKNDMFYNVRQNIIKHSFPLLYADRNLINLILEKLSQFKIVKNTVKLKLWFDKKLKTDDYLQEHLSFFLVINNEPEYIEKFLKFEQSLNIISNKYTSIDHENYINKIEFAEEEMNMFFDTRKWLDNQSLLYKDKMIEKLQRQEE